MSKHDDLDYLIRNYMKYIKYIVFWIDIIRISVISNFANRLIGINSEFNLYCGQKFMKDLTHNDKR